MIETIRFSVDLPTLIALSNQYLEGGDVPQYDLLDKYFEREKNKGLKVVDVGEVEEVLEKLRVYLETGKY